MGADKAYDTADFVDQVRDVDMTPLVAQNDTRRGGSAMRRPHDATSRLCDESTCPPAH